MRNPFFGKTGPLTIMRKRSSKDSSSLFLLPPPSPRRSGRPPRGGSGSLHGGSADSMCSSEDGGGGGSRRRPRRRLRNSSLASTSNSSTSSAPNHMHRNDDDDDEAQDDDVGMGPVSLDDDISVGDVGVVGTASSGFLFSAGDTESYDDSANSPIDKRPTPRRCNAAGERETDSLDNASGTCSWNSPGRGARPPDEEENQFEALDYFHHCLDQASPTEQDSKKSSPKSPDLMSQRSSFVSQITDGTCGTDVTEVTHKRRNTACKSPSDRKRGREATLQLKTLATEEDSEVCLADLEVEQILSGDGGQGGGGGGDGLQQIIVSTPVRKRPFRRNGGLPRRPPTPPSTSNSAPSPSMQHRARNATDIYCTPPRRHYSDYASLPWETTSDEPSLMDCPSDPFSPRAMAVDTTPQRPLSRRRRTNTGGGSHNSSTLESFLPSIFSCCNPEGAAANVDMENDSVLQVTKPIPVKHQARKTHGSATPPTVTSTPAISIDNEDHPSMDASPGKGKLVDDALLLEMARLKVSGMTKDNALSTPPVAVALPPPPHHHRRNSDRLKTSSAATQFALGTLRPRTKSGAELDFNESFRSIGTAATNHEATYRPPLPRPPTPQRIHSQSSKNVLRRSLSDVKSPPPQRVASSRSILDSESDAEEDDDDDNDFVLSPTLTGHVEIAVATPTKGNEEDDDPFPHSATPRMILRDMSGPESGTVRVAPKEGPAPDLVSDEVCGAYLSYRASRRDVEEVFSHLDTVVPLHHNVQFDTGGDYQAATLGRAFVAIGRPPPLPVRSNSMGSDSEPQESFFAIDTCFDRRRRALSAVDNICSEPDASNIKVRGPRYRTDGVKVPSEEAMFSLLGVDSLIRDPKVEPHADSFHCCQEENSFLQRLRARCKAAGVRTPFLLVYNLVLPWGNVIVYLHRPDATDSGPFHQTRLQQNVGSEVLWKKFLTEDDKFRNQRLKFIPHVWVGPWMVKRMVGQTPALIGQKLPVSYFGSVEDGYLEVCLDVTLGSHLAHGISSHMVAKSETSSVTLDLAFLVEGREGEELPERVLSAVRLHHLVMKHCRSKAHWQREVQVRHQIRRAAQMPPAEEEL